MKLSTIRDLLRHANQQEAQRKHRRDTWRRSRGREAGAPVSGMKDQRRLSKETVALCEMREARRAAGQPQNGAPASRPRLLTSALEIVFACPVSFVMTLW